MDELKKLSNKLIEALSNNPSVCRAALVEVLPDVIKGMRDIGQDKTIKSNIRHACFDELLALQARVIREDLHRATVACRRREAECRVIEAQVVKIKAKAEAMAEQRRHRADVAKALRVIAKAKKVTSNAAQA
jgi:hypothetical protein